RRPLDRVQDGGTGGGEMRRPGGTAAPVAGRDGDRFGEQAEAADIQRTRRQQPRQRLADHDERIRCMLASARLFPTVTDPPEEPSMTVTAADLKKLAAYDT